MGVCVSRAAERSGARASAARGLGLADPRGRPGSRLRLTAPFSLSVSACVAVGGAAAASDVPQDGLLLHGPFARKPKRIRTAFSPSQLLRLERAFEKNHYVVGAERKQLAHSLSLTETQVSERAPGPATASQISGLTQPPELRALSGNRRGTSSTPWLKVYTFGGALSFAGFQQGALEPSRPRLCRDGLSYSFCKAGLDLQLLHKASLHFWRDFQDTAGV